MLRKKRKAPLKAPVEVNPTYIGYARVSTEEQNLQMQLDTLAAAGCHPDHVHVEKVSARSDKRSGLEAALMDCNEGDTLVVWKLDRFGRDMLDVLSRLDRMEKAGIRFRSLTENFDTSTPMGRAFMGMCAVFAQFESDMTRARTKAGIASARARGTRFGRLPKIPPDDYGEMLALRDSGYSPQQIADHYGTSRQTAYVTIEKALAAQKRRRR